MDTDLSNLQNTLKDAGCSDEEIREAKRLFQIGDPDVLTQHLRRCRCGRMEELHKSQRRVDCLDYLIRKTEKSKHKAV